MTDGETLEAEGVARHGGGADVRGTGAAVTGNAVHTSDAKNRLPLWITGGNTFVTGNLFENVTLVVNDKTDENKPIVIKDNIMENSVIDHQKGNLVAPDAPDR